MTCAAWRPASATAAMSRSTDSSGVDGIRRFASAIREVAILFPLSALRRVQSPIMRLFAAMLFFAVPAFSQGGVQFRDYQTPAPTARPRVSCAGLVAMTGYELSVYSAATIPASDSAPEHCRVGVLVQPDMNIEVNLPTQWNGRLYMFGNGGY